MRLALLAVSAAAFFAAPALAAAAPPTNDNYLASLPIDNADFHATVDTTEATTQPDLWNPSRDGQPLGGYVAETTNCKGTNFGKTVWYDLAPQAPGFVTLQTSAVFPVEVSLYEWGADSKIKRLVACGPGALDGLTAQVEGKHNYTVQIGGADSAGGAISLVADYFPDTDGDGKLDGDDDCVTVPGTSGGCPPRLPAVPALRYDPTGSGVRINGLVVDGVPKGAKLVVTCPGCGTQKATAKKQGSVKFPKLAGKTVRSGAKVTLKVTLGHSGTGKYKYGAIGSVFQWPVKSDGLGKRVNRCVAVKTGKVVTCSAATK
jgi:hypothetical protein